jgi:chromosome segregation ATPase
MLRVQVFSRQHMDTTPESLLEKLKEGLNLVETLKKENQHYRDNFEQLTLDFATLQEKHERVSKEFVTVTKEKESILEDLDGLKERFKHRLQEKDKELQDLKQKPLPQKDLDLIKFEILQNVEQSQKEKFALVERECTKFRNLYYKVKREWDGSRNEYELKAAENDRKMKQKNQEHQIEISNLESKIATLQANMQDISELERLRITQREKTELEIKVKELLSELEELRAEKEDLRLQSEKDQRTFKRQLADHITEAKTFQSEKQSLQSRLVQFEEEFRLTTRRKDELVEENHKLSKELDKVTTKLEERTHQFTMDLSDAKLVLMKEKKEHENQLEQWSSKVSQLQSENKGLQEIIAEQKEKISSLERDYLDKLRLAREEEWSKISLSETERHEVEKQLSQLKQRYADQEVTYEKLQSDYFTEVDRLKKEIHEHKLTIEQLQSDCKELTAAKEHQTLLAEKSRQKQEEAHVQMIDATNSIDTLQRQVNQLNDTISRLQVQNKELEQSASDASEQLSKELEAYEHTLERHLLKFQQEKQRYIQEMEYKQREVLKVVEKIKMTEDVLEKQQQMYETRIQVLKEKVKIYKQESADSKHALEAFHLKEQQRQEMVSFIN